MSDTKFVLAKAVIDGKTVDLVAHSDGEHTTVNYKGREMSLDSALASVSENGGNVGEFAADSEVMDIFKI